jgi:photosystem II stability/assembly factor-like uncharacterized protein
MKHATLFCAGVTAAFLLASCASAGGYASGAQTAPKAYAAGFTDAQNGVTVGYAGLVLRSTDGGKSWENGTNRSMCLFALENLGCGSWIAAGNQGNVTFTIDGGKSWSRLTSVPPARVTSLSFTSPAHGWASTRGWIGETVDGGKSWNALGFPEGMPPAETVASTGSGTGFFVGSDGYLYATTDGGTNWSRGEALCPAPSDGFRAVSSVNGQTRALRFRGNRGLFACAGISQKQSVMLLRETADGGKTWTEPTIRRLKTPLASIFISPDFFISGLALDTSVLRFGTPD